MYSSKGLHYGSLQPCLRIGWNRLEENTLAYYNMATMTILKNIVQPRSHIHNTSFSLLIISLAQ
jgi:hypothetical protein